MQTSSFKPFGFAVAILVISFLSGCGDDNKNKDSLLLQEPDSQERLETLEVYSQALALRTTQLTNEVSHMEAFAAKGGGQVALLSEKSELLRVAIVAAQNLINDPNSSAESVAQFMKANVEPELDSFLQSVAAIEQHFSKDLIEAFSQNPDNSMKTAYRELSSYLTYLKGFRSLGMGAWNDLQNFYRIRFQKSYQEALPAQPEPAVVPEASRPTRPSNPIVSSMQEGGQIYGVARNSLTGRPVAGAMVGFKFEASDLQYFHQTYTNQQGEYRSPYLAPGTY
jgi:hypothetical protein